MPVDVPFEFCIGEACLIFEYYMNILRILFR